MRSVVRTLFRYAPTKRCAAIVLALAPVWLLSEIPAGQAVIALTLAVFVVTLVIDALRIPPQFTIDVRRTIPNVLPLREDGEGEFKLTSHVRASFKASLQQRVSSSLEQTLPAEVLIKGRQSTTVPFTIMATNRGLHPLNEVAITIQSLLGLTVKTYIYDLNDTILAIPPTKGAKGFRLLAIQQRMRIAGNRALRLRGGGTAFANLREYTPGDDPRHIDWKATARKQRLITKEYTVEQGQTVFIAVDAGRMMTQLAGDRSRFEYALSSALILADVALTAGDRVGLMVFSDEVQSYIDPGKGRDTLFKIRDALISASATMVEPDYAGAFRTLAHRNTKRSLIVLFSDVIDPTSSKSIVVHATYSARRHLPLFVALQNDQLIHAAHPSPTADDLGAFQTVAAEELLEARNDVLQHMRQVGVNVLDTPPHAMTAALINRYLEIKDRGLL